MFKKIHFSALIFFLSFIFCSNLSYPQTGDITFKWIDTNVSQVTFNAFEVSAPPDTNNIISKLNALPIVCNNDTCLWSTTVIYDDKVHYYRMNAVKNDTLESVLSNTPSALLELPVKSPIILQIIPAGITEL